MRLSIALSDRRGEAIEGVDGHIIGVLVRGAVYGVRATDGELAWRRYVGYESDAFPVTVSEEAGSDILIVDAAHSELQRVKAATGELVWRLPCQSPISTTIVSGKQAYISCGRDSESTLLSVDLKSTDGAKVIAGRQVSRWMLSCTKPVRSTQRNHSSRQSL